MEATDLRQVRLFSRLSDKVLAEVESALETRTVADREVLFEMGEVGEELFLVREGRIAIFVPDEEHPGEEQPLRIFEPPEVLGEMALIDRQPRSVSARALVKTTVQVLPGAAFRRLLRANPDMALAVMAGLSERIRYTTDFLWEVREWVARVAEGKYARAMEADRTYNDSSIHALAAEFAQMAAQVQQREEELRQQVVKLRIQIDNQRRQRHVEEITETDYFQSLQEQARQMRSRDKK